MYNFLNYQKKKGKSKEKICQTVSWGSAVHWGHGIEVFLIFEKFSRIILYLIFFQQNDYQLKQFKLVQQKGGKVKATEPLAGDINHSLPKSFFIISTRVVFRIQPVWLTLPAESNGDDGSSSQT